MATALTFHITTTRFDADYAPSDSSRLTTNFANLARGRERQQNLRNALMMIDRRFNDLASWDNPDGDRYTLELDIVSVGVQLTDDSEEPEFPLLEMLDIQIVDQVTDIRRHGIVGNNFSSYVRDFDFSILLPAVNEQSAEFATPRDFGELLKLFPALPGLSGVPRALRAPSRHLHQRLDEQNLFPDRQSPSDPRGRVPSGRLLADRRVLRQDGPSGPVLHAPWQRRSARVLLPR